MNSQEAKVKLQSLTFDRIGAVRLSWRSEELSQGLDYLRVMSKVCSFPKRPSLQGSQWKPEQILCDVQKTEIWILTSFL